MKPMPAILTIIILAAAATGTTADPVFEQRVSADLESAPVTYALDIIHRACNLSFDCPPELVADARVTLHTEQLPVDEVLRDILHPHGLVAVRTAADTCTVMREATPIGMAKVGGRALRTLWRLERKLEVVGPDGLPAPDWSDADDRRLALAAFDLAASMAWFEMLKAEYLDSRRHEPLPTAWELVHSMYTAFDPDVRAGAIVPSKVLENAMSFDTEDAKRARASLLTLLEDPDPLVRACAFRALPWTVYRSYDDERTTALTNAVQSASADPAPEVRLAASLMCRSLHEIDGGRQILGALRADDSPAVRLVAWMLWLDDMPLGARPDVQQEIADDLLTDPNPVVRAAATVALILASYRGTFMVEGVFAAADPNDPVVQRALAVCRASADAKWFGLMLELLASDKRFDQALGVVGLAASSFGRTFRGEAIQRLALVLRLGNTDTLLGRAVGAGTHAVMRTPDADALLLKSLTSADELDRALALLACALARQDFPAEIKAALRSCLASPAFSEQSLAARAIRATFPFDEYLPLVKDAVARAPKSSLADLLLLPLCTPAKTLLGKSTDLADERRVELLDILLSSSDHDLQMRTLLRSRKYLRHDALLRHFMKKAPADVLVGAIGDDRLGSVNFRFHAAGPVLQRLGAMLQSSDPSEREVALGGMKTCVEIACHGRPGYNFPAIALLAKMMEVYMADGAEGGHFARGLEHLAAMVGLKGVMAYDKAYWESLPESIRHLSRRALLLVNDPDNSRHALGILCSLQFYAHYARKEENAAMLRRDTELMTALAEARRKLMEEGPAESQVALLTTEARMRDDKLAPAARAELERRVLGGEVAATTPGVLWDLSEHPTPKLKQYLLKQLRDRQEMVEVRRSAAYFLGRAYRDDGEALVDAAELLEQDPVVGARLFYSAREWIAQHKDEPRPPWTLKAVDLATGMLKKAGLASSTKRMLSDFVIDCSADKGRTLQAFVLDPTSERERRRTAAYRLRELDGADLDFTPFAEHYDDLPFAVRRTIAEVVGKNGTAPGAVDFALRFLRDPETRYGDIYYIVDSRSLPNTPELKNAKRGAHMGLAITRTIKLVIGRLKRVSELVR